MCSGKAEVSEERSSSGRRRSIVRCCTAVRQSLEVNRNSEQVKKKHGHMGDGQLRA
jgi:hypothetical protein